MQVRLCNSDVNPAAIVRLSCTNLIQYVALHHSNAKCSRSHSMLADVVESTQQKGVLARSIKVIMAQRLSAAKQYLRLPAW